jgi:integrase
MRKVASGYGRWLGFLQRTGQLDPAEPSSQRPTAERLDAYFEHLQQCRNRDYTVVARFDELRAALQWMHSSTSFGWITHPHGVSIKARLPMIRRAGLVPDSATLLAWAEALFRQALRLHNPRCRRAQVREAVMIAILAECAPRLRAFAALRIGVHLYRTHDAWVLDQAAALTKTNKRLVLPLSPEVAVMLDRYLEVERVELLDGADNDALWISAGRGTLAEATISRRIRMRSKQRFGEAFGPHRFRSSLATTLAESASDNPLDAMTLLGHSTPQVTITSYDHSTGHAAAGRHSERLKRLRDQAVAQLRVNRR